jgi:hypothetical protein
MRIEKLFLTAETDRRFLHPRRRKKGSAKARVVLRTYELHYLLYTPAATSPSFSTTTKSSKASHRFRTELRASLFRENIPNGCLRLPAEKTNLAIPPGFGRTDSAGFSTRAGVDVLPYRWAKVATPWTAGAVVALAAGLPTNDRPQFAIRTGTGGGIDTLSTCCLRAVAPCWMLDHWPAESVLHR